MPRPKRGDPELLLVSFCDIVTIVVAALFMAMVVVIDQTSRIPSIIPIPEVKDTELKPVYFECRNRMIFPIDRAGLWKVFQTNASAFRSNEGATMVERLAKLDVGDQYYRIDYGLAMMGMMGLVPRPAAKGIAEAEIKASTNNPFSSLLAVMDKNSQYCVFYVREDSYSIYRACRSLCIGRKIHQGWEYVAMDEPLTFEGEMRDPGVQ